LFSKSLDGPQLSRRQAVNAQPMHEEDYDEPVSIFHKAKRWFFGEEEHEDLDPTGPRTDGETHVQPRRHQHLGVHTVRSNRVNVRRNAQVFDDAKAAADGLKNGEQQIVNLERATPQMTERIIDFLNGVCYALDGTVERIGDKVYMFVPANVIVEVDDGNNTAVPSGRRTQYGE
jgi:cell division inhibitor SepF